MYQPAALKRYRLTLAIPLPGDRKVVEDLLAQPPANQERFTISIPLPGDREVVTKCRVRRRHQDGVGVEFEQLDWEDLFALARFLHPRLP